MTFVLPQGYRQLPQTWEMTQPFQIDGTGTVGFDTDPIKWATNHLLALLLTIPGERVMRPGYGVGIYALVFENDDPLIEQQIISAINIGLNMWEPNILVVQVDFIQQPMYQGVMELQISFTIGASPTVHSVGFTMSGTGVEVAT